MVMKKDLRYVVPFAGFTEFVASIPKLYWGVKSQEQRIIALCKNLNKLVCYADYQSEKINLNRKDIDYLLDQFEKFKESGFEDYYLQQIEKWVNDHLEVLYNNLVKQVYFGLTLDGYFVAYIPESWKDIKFDTGIDYSKDTYGRLILRWNVDSEHEVNQTPEERI